MLVFLLSLCIGIILYVLLFHVVLFVFSFFIRPIVYPRYAKDWPSVTIITCAYNEATVLKQKIENSKTLQYPGELRHIFVSDGSSDATATILETQLLADWDMIAFESNQGKTMCQNIAMQVVDTDISVFTDANTMLASDTLMDLVSPFQDTTIGCVSGAIQLIEGAGKNIERWYWRFESRLKQVESRLHSAIGATGGLYAIRTSLYVPLASNIISDLIEPLHIYLRGGRTVYQPRAVASETIGAQHTEQGRKKRILTRALRSIWTVRSVYNPLRHPYMAWLILSHKFGRWIVPMLLYPIIGLSMVLWPVSMGISIVTYVVAFGIVRFVFPSSVLFRVWTYAHMLIWSATRGWIQALQRKDIISWQVSR